MFVCAANIGQSDGCRGKIWNRAVSFTGTILANTRSWVQRSILDPWRPQSRPSCLRFCTFTDESVKSLSGCHMQQSPSISHASIMKALSNSREPSPDKLSDSLRHPAADLVNRRIGLDTYGPCAACFLTLPVLRSPYESMENHAYKKASPLEQWATHSG